MSLRFRKSIKIFPGVRFNLSKSGVSTSIGVRGATVNLKGGKTMTTVGLPGTGISYREQTTRKGIGSLLMLIVIAVVAWFVL